MIYKILLLVLLPFVLFAHGDKKHEENNSTVSITKNAKELKSERLYQDINKSYVETIKPIFENKCFDCHGTLGTYPWYYKIPGIKQMIEYDMKEAKKHLDMEKDFPFISHETPLEDLKSLKEVALEGDMPPFRYLLGHWDASLTEDEKEKLIKWTQESIDKLEAKK